MILSKPTSMSTIALSPATRCAKPIVRARQLVMFMSRAWLVLGMVLGMALAYGVNAAQAATLSISANPVSVTSGAASTLTWSSTEATSCAASGAWSGVKATSGSQSVIAPNGLNSYALNCSGPGGSASNTAVISAGTTSVVWQPSVSDTFHLQLRGTLHTNVSASIYVIDLFDNSAAQIAQLKQQGRKVVCYFSAGSSENWRTDFASFLVADKGSPLQGWPGENWLDIRSSNVRSIMQNRMGLAVSKGCDGVDPDNVDGYTNQSGFPLTAQDQLDYNRFLSSQAHSRGLAIGLKNNVEQISELVTSFDFAVNEQCHEFTECGGYQAFILMGKPVLNVEYQSRYVSNTGGAFDALCVSARAENLRTLVLPMSLDGSSRLSCD